MKTLNKALGILTLALSIVACKQSDIASSSLKVQGSASNLCLKKKFNCDPRVTYARTPDEFQCMGMDCNLLDLTEQSTQVSIHRFSGCGPANEAGAQETYAEIVSYLQEKGFKVAADDSYNWASEINYNTHVLKKSSIDQLQDHDFLVTMDAVEGWDMNDMSQAYSWGTKVYIVPSQNIDLSDALGTDISNTDLYQDFEQCK